MARHVVRPSAGISLLLSHHSFVRYPLADCGQPKYVFGSAVQPETAWQCCMCLAVLYSLKLPGSAVQPVTACN